MRAVDLAEMLREVLDVKIRKCRREMLDTYMQIEVERIQAQIMAYQWVQARIQDMGGMPVNVTKFSGRIVSKLNRHR
jgi:hypothetical protein